MVQKYAAAEEILEQVGGVDGIKPQQLRSEEGGKGQNPSPQPPVIPARRSPGPQVAQEKEADGRRVEGAGQRAVAGQFHQVERHPRPDVSREGKVGHQAKVD